MASYRGTQRQDQAKALAGVVLVHAALGAVILTGLNVRTVSEAVERLNTFDINEPPPPPPPPPPPQRRAQRAREEEGAAGKKADPTPVVAPKPAIVVPAKPPIVAAPIAGTGNAPRSGAAATGTGTGAGGSGSGRGGGGAGVGEGGGSGPRLLTGAPTRGDYRRLGARISGRTQATVRLTIDPNGRVADCSVARSTGYPDVDARICPLLQGRMRWEPGRNRAGQPITTWLHYILDFTRY